MNDASVKIGKGAILFHSKFEFTNGEIGEKLIIILNNPDPAREPFLVCRTTSQPRGKPQSFGCHEKLSLFFLPVSHDFFEKDTWIQLHEVFPFEASSLLADKLQGKLKIKGELQDLTIRQLMNCIRRVKDIPLRDKKMILRK